MDEGPIDVGLGHERAREQRSARERTDRAVREAGDDSDPDGRRDQGDECDPKPAQDPHDIHLLAPSRALVGYSHGRGKDKSPS